MVRKGKNTSFDTRQLVIYNREKGKSYREIGTLLNLSKSTVADIIRRYNREDRIESVAQTGRPKLLDIREKRNIIRKVSKDPKLSAPWLAAELFEKTGKKFILTQFVECSMKVDTTVEFPERSHTLTL